MLLGLILQPILVKETLTTMKQILLKSFISYLLLGVSFKLLAQPGTFDQNYYYSMGAENTVTTGVANADGSVVIGGRFQTFNRGTVNGMVKLNTDGSVNPTFNVGGGFNNVVNAMAVQPDGKIIVAGDFTSVNGFSYNRIAGLS